MSPKDRIGWSSCSKVLLQLFVLLSCMGSAFAQSSPPGFSGAHTASWLALGYEQALDSLHSQQWVGYVGLGRKSDPDDYNPMHRSAIVVVNQEYSNRFHRHWQYSAALSYRVQEEYSSSPPYDHAEPESRNELRLYGRYAYIGGGSRFKFAATLRQELRRFYTPAFTPWHDDIELRTRFRMQGTWMLDQHGQSKVVASAEPLFSSRHTVAASDHWSPLRYAESRFCLFFATHPTHLPIEVSVGYMDDLLGHGTPHEVHYVAMSVLWEDPFHWH